MSEEHLPLWAQYVQGAAVVAIALLGAWIAGKQMQIARTRLQLDLYEKRHGVFAAARKFLGHAFQRGTATDEAMKEYALGIADAVFLFDDEMAKYLKNIWGNVVTMRTAREAAEPLAPGDQKAQYMGEALKQVQWASEQLDVLTDKFRPWLRLEQRGSRLGAWFWR